MGDYLRTLLQVVIKVFTDKGFNEAAEKIISFSRRHFSDEPQGR
jgi:hypothetical protein